MSVDAFLQKSIDIANTEVEIETEDVPEDISWHFDSMWKGQKDAVYNLSKTDKPIWLCSPTGSGKSPIIVSVAENKNNNGGSMGSLIVVPRKSLQDQFRGYGVFTVFGKANYRCNLYHDEFVSASEAPCIGRTSSGIFCPIIEDWCVSSSDCPEGGCYCYECNYKVSRDQAKRLLRDKKTVCCNAWNFFMFLRYCDNVLIDEADLVFDALCSAKKLKHVDLKYKDDSIHDLIIRELMGLQEEMSKINKKLSSAKKSNEVRENAKKKYALEQREAALSFLNESRNSCFKYVEDDYIHIEVKPMDIDVLLRQYFKDKSLVLISATPFVGEFEEISYEIPHRSAIFYRPTGNMSVTNVNKNPLMIDKAVDEISEIYDRYVENELTQKAVIHCGRLQWAESVGQKLRDKGYKVDIHQQGEQRTAVDTFRINDSQFICLVAAEYGIDFSEDEIRLQFILKVPYAPRTERVRALEREQGYKSWYKLDAIQKLVQASGRVARGTKHSTTFILDNKFRELYKQFNDVLPTWFKERLYFERDL